MHIFHSGNLNCTGARLGRGPAVVSRETRAQALYEFARALSGALQTEQIFDTTRAYIARTFQAQAILLLPDEAGQLHPPANTTGTDKTLIDVIDLGIAQSVFNQATSAGIGTDDLPGSHFFYLPLIAPMRTRGVLAIWSEKRNLIPEHRQQLDTFAALAAIALERIHYIEVAQDALIRMESERLRNSLLAALSHDLRTPLTTIVGLSESLATYPSLSTQRVQEFVHILRDEAIRMRNLVTNLLDMAHIQSGEVKLNLQWQPFEEVVGCALRASQHTLQKHHVQTILSPDLPLIQFDAILIERVLCNLLENAAKYTPEGSRIKIAAKTSGKHLEIAVSDNGPGLPPGKEDAIFEKFTRGKPESATPGVGLGLAICRAIAQAHGGAIGAGISPDGGASIVLTLVLGTPPDIVQMEDINPEHAHHA